MSGQLDGPVSRPAVIDSFEQRRRDCRSRLKEPTECVAIAQGWGTKSAVGPPVNNRRPARNLGQKKTAQHMGQIRPEAGPTGLDEKPLPHVWTHFLFTPSLQAKGGGDCVAQIGGSRVRPLVAEMKAGARIGVCQSAGDEVGARGSQQVRCEVHYPRLARDRVRCKGRRIRRWKGSDQAGEAPPATC